ncbi:unnamed protein product [Spirodela intermedia]|uniref:Uncharacterized protein n=1 Tax=Spirodela intermedia TaxID=51605 RepID=A0A7I8IKN6_SPIIN|nr:unnamed protein product [Spirodela intermedia]CAA6657963.1 unnamed protein product [Spirodela intermedia]
MVLEDGAKELAEELKEQKQTAVLLVKLSAGLIFTIYGPLHRVIFCVSAILLILAAAARWARIVNCGVLIAIALVVMEWAAAPAERGDVSQAGVVPVCGEVTA